MSLGAASHGIVRTIGPVINGWSTCRPTSARRRRP